MVIEWLKFRVVSQLQEKFLQKDAEIWTPLLASYPGFLGKETWFVPEKTEEIILVIRWHTRKQWKSIPLQILSETEREFLVQMGENNYEMIETREFEIGTGDW